MRLVVLREQTEQETRVAVTPDLAKKYNAAGYQVMIEENAGQAAGYPDEHYHAAGASLFTDIAAALKEADLVLTVQAPSVEQLQQMKQGAVVVGMLDPHRQRIQLDVAAAQKITLFAMELVPRITRAQSMDVLSSQANLAGYRAVLEAAQHYKKAFPMLMTAAGSIAPARVFVMGAGVAGLQAIATAKRLGAIVSATDVRMVAKEQVESLGASFVMVEDDELKQAETSGGYAKEMSDAYKQKQAAFIADHIQKQDVVICTALIPGRPAPVLVTEEMVKSMKPGSVIVDMAVAQGGNYPNSVKDQVVEQHNVTIVGYSNLPSRVATDASQLYAKNLQNFLALITDARGPVMSVDWNDEIVRASALTHDGKLVHPQFGGPAAAAPTQAA
ncbi:MAG TPA: Re/Si-specific NAD(P)(+) transhydrogenase subunit alpha [Alphaproteobacteria bacterium]